MTSGDRHGKTYIAAAVIDYLAAAGIRNLLFVCPGTTILNKTVTNFTPGHAKFVDGMEVRPTVITSEDFQRGSVSEALRTSDDFKLFVFNVQQLLRLQRTHRGGYGTTTSTSAPASTSIFAPSMTWW